MYINEKNDVIPYCAYREGVVLLVAIKFDLYEVLSHEISAFLIVKLAVKNHERSG